MLEHMAIIQVQTLHSIAITNIFVSLSVSHSKYHACLCVSATSSNMQTPHSINSNINKHCLFYSVSMSHGSRCGAYVVCLSSTRQYYKHSIVITISMRKMTQLTTCTRTLSSNQLVVILSVVALVD